MITVSWQGVAGATRGGRDMQGIDFKGKWKKSFFSWVVGYMVTELPSFTSKCNSQSFVCG